MTESCVSYKSDSTKIKRAIRRSEPIEIHGLTCWPLTMEYFEEWQSLKPVLLFRLATLPARLAVMPYLSAMYAAETEYFLEHGSAIGLYGNLMRLLELVLHLPDKKDTPKQRGAIRVETSKDGRTLLRLHIKQDKRIVTITPQQFNSIRELIAMQSGETLPNEADNLEIIEAEAQVAARGGSELILDMDDLLASVAVATGKTLRELDNMSIWEFNHLYKAADRAKKFFLYGMAEANGGKIKGGNPCPSWCFDRVPDSKALISASQWQQEINKGGSGAIQMVTPDAMPSSFLM